MGKSLIANCLMPDKISDMLVSGVDNIIKVDVNTKLPTPVASHPDMHALVLDDTVIVSKELFMASETLRRTCNGKNTVIAERELGNSYPADVLLNALLVGRKLFARRDSLDISVIKTCQKKCIEIVNVKQGYAKCSTLTLGDKALISADSTIVNAAKNYGIDALLISSGHINLKGYNYGFIGGASFFNFENNTVYFFGDIKYHPDFKKIKSFIEKYEIDIVCTNDSPLYDYGGAVVIY